MRQFFEASEIAALLIGFAVAEVKDGTETDENGIESDTLVFTYVNEHHVAVQVLITSHGNYVSEPYAVKDDLSVIKNSETKC